MNLRFFELSFFIVCLAVFTNCNTNKIEHTDSITKPAILKNDSRVIVTTVDDFHAAIAEAQPSDTIFIANGIWNDAELKFSADGTEETPIYIVAEEKGKVTFEGQSNIKIGGSYIHVEGLVFKNGFTATSSVISFQKDKQTPCSHCRVTQCVIDNYNPSERFDTDNWVEIYGKHNRFDHNYLVGKRNRGVTLAVRLKNESDRENFHQIDHNYFGYRPILGSNGGETLRVGTSHYSQSNSNTVVQDNYFEKCSGELEIISSKSCQNTFSHNTFYECQGTLTMRHGNETIVDNNYFFGNRKPNTGGIRLINETQTVKNNYLEGLTGNRFRSALVIMNGVPNSPLNRYFQVKDSEVSHNLVYDCDHVQLCAGSDEERSATPIQSSFKHNIIHSSQKSDVFTIYDDISGIHFESNILSNNIVKPSFNGKEVLGFKNSNINFIQSNGLKTVANKASIGVISKKDRPSATNTGVNWYPKKNYEITFNTGRTIQVEPGENTLQNAINSATSGDILELAPGNYLQTRSISIDKTLTIRSSTTTTKPVVTFERSPLFALENDGSISLQGLHISGKDSDDYSGNSVIRTSRYSMISNYKLIVDNCLITDLDVNHSFNFLKIYKNTFADSIAFRNSVFENISGHVLNMDKEIDDTGIYNVENVVVENCQFKSIGGSAIKLYRGGRDESTFGPMIWLTDSSFEHVGKDKRNKNQTAIDLSGVQLAELNNVNISDSEKLNLHLIVGEPVIKLSNIKLINTELTSNSDAFQKINVISVIE